MAQSGDFAMNGGNGPLSYAKNSSFQGNMGNLVKRMLEEAISEKLEMSYVSLFTRFCIADFGCSTGPNTFSAVQTITQALQQKFDSDGSISCMPELLVYFNDRTSNDFNTLFMSLPPSRNYFAAGVPGTFYGRLFPRATLHIGYSAITLHWLSKVPMEVVDESSEAWNRGKITYIEGPPPVVHAYEKQFARDFDAFLSLRGEEMVEKGLLALLMPLGKEDRKLCNSSLAIFLLESALQDMASEGVIHQKKIDTFNMPIFLPNAKELTGLIESNGKFDMERMEKVYGSADGSGLGVMDPKLLAMHTRSGLQQILGNHFGEDIIDQLFDRLEKKLAQRSDTIAAEGGFLLPALFLLLKHRA